jgi:hypothetical protein
MCCPLILCREEIISGAKGLDIKNREEGGERRSANLEDKMS